MSSRLHVAILDEELPFPTDSGKRLRTWHLVSRLAARHRVTYLCHRNADPGEARVALDAFRNVGVEVRCTGLPLPPKRGVGFPLRLAANLLSSRPYSVDSHHRSSLARLAARVAAEGPVDVWHCEWTPYAHYMRALAPPRWLVMAHNVESQIWRRLAAGERRMLARWYLHGQWRKYGAFERWAYAAAPVTVTVSDDDAARVRRDFGGRDVEVVPNGVDIAGLRPADRPGDPRRVLFLGSLDWRPNLDGLRRLLDDAWPRVLAAEPGARLAVVGRHPPAWLGERLAATPGAELHANVPDVRPHLQAAGALAVPLEAGGGSRLKILEALAVGLPVVSTDVGAEGLDLEPGRHYTPAADTGAAFADALVGVMRGHAAALAQASRGRDRVAARYDWPALADRLERVWLRLAGTAASPGRAGGRGVQRVAGTAVGSSA
jgi:glycosyltransferase involved in cell wall biosynthesis